MSDLAEFLLARIAEDEAQISARGPCDCHIEGMPLEHGYFCPVPRLAECEARRRIVERWQIWLPYYGGQLYEDVVRQLAYEDVVRLLAEVYSGHPHYREEWRPDTP